MLIKWNVSVIWFYMIKIIFHTYYSWKNKIRLAPEELMKSWIAQVLCLFKTFKLTICLIMSMQQRSRLWFYGVQLQAWILRFRS